MAECESCGTDYRPDAADSTACPLCAMQPSNWTFRYDDSYTTTKSIYEIGAKRNPGDSTCNYQGPRGPYIYRTRPCRDCGKKFDPDSPMPRCPACAEAHKQNKHKRIKLYLPPTVDMPPGRYTIRYIDKVTYKGLYNDSYREIYKGKTTGEAGHKRTYTIYRSRDSILIEAKAPEGWFQVCSVL